MKKRFIVLGVIVGIVAIAAASITYTLLRKPKSSEELVMKAILAMQKVKSFDVDGNIDAEASIASFSLPANVTFDGNYNMAETSGLINYTVTTNVFGQDYDYSNTIDLTNNNPESTSTEAAESTTEISDDYSGVLEEILEESEFEYNKDEQTYSIIVKMEDIITIEPIEEKLFGEEGVLSQVGITEEMVCDAVNDDAEATLTFDKKYFLSEISITSMDIEKDIDLDWIGMGSIPAKISFETDIHVSNYQ